MNKNYKFDIVHHNYPHIQTGTTISNVMESRNLLTENIRKNMTVENHVLFERSCVMIVDMFSI